MGKHEFSLLVCEKNGEFRVTLPLSNPQMSQSLSSKNLSAASGGTFQKHGCRGPPLIFSMRNYDGGVILWEEKMWFNSRTRADALRLSPHRSAYSRWSVGVLPPTDITSTMRPLCEKESNTVTSAPKVYWSHPVIFVWGYYRLLADMSVIRLPKRATRPYCANLASSLASASRLHFFKPINLSHLSTFSVALAGWHL